MLEYPDWLHPVIFKFWFIEIRWYSLFYLLGFIFCYISIPKLAQERNLKISKKAYDDLWIYLILGVIVGARLGHVFLFEPMYYLKNLTQILAIWNGGLAFHGGLLGGLLAGWLFCRKYKISYWDLVDIFTLPISLGLAFGRFGNFTNAELWGKLSNLPWAISFPTTFGYRHPTQIYSSFKNFFIFGILFSSRKKLQNKPGAMSALFISLYAILRFVVEFFRENDTLFFNLISPAQIYCVFMLLGASFIFYAQKGKWAKKQSKKK